MKIVGGGTRRDHLISKLQCLFGHFSHLSVCLCLHALDASFLDLHLFLIALRRVEINGNMVFPDTSHVQCQPGE